MNLEVARQLFSPLVSNTILSIDTQTTVPLLGGKANPMKDRVIKIVTGSRVMAFGNVKSNGYENKVKRHMVAEGLNPDLFRLSPRKWGRRLHGTAFVEHNGKFYLEVIFLACGAIQYMLDGTPIAKEYIVGLKPPVEAEQGGIENKVILRDYALDSIIAVRAFGEKFD